MHEPEMTDEQVQDFVSSQLSGPPILNRPAEPTGVPPVDWRHLSPEESRVAWTTLRKWVEWFTVRYELSISLVPPCWWKHGELVEELSALHILHQASFDKNDTGFGPIGWHERLAQAKERIRRTGSGCSSKHASSRPRSWVGQTDEAEWDAWVDQSHAG
jgi:hypothetical protein